MGTRKFSLIGYFRDYLIAVRVLVHFLNVLHFLHSRFGSVAAHRNVTLSRPAFEGKPAVERVTIAFLFPPRPPSRNPISFSLNHFTNPRKVPFNDFKKGVLLAQQVLDIQRSVAYLHRPFPWTFIIWNEATD